MGTLLLQRKLMPGSSNNETILCPLVCDPSNVTGLCVAPCEFICSGYCADSHDDHPRAHKVSALMAAMFAILAATFLLVCVYVAYVRWHRRRSLPPPPPPPPRGAEDDDFLDDEEHGAVVDHPIWYIRTLGLQPSVINAITVCRYKKGEGLVEGTECSVCLNEFHEDETLRLLPKCSHAFHLPCIDTWLRSHTSCPMCRAPIVTGPLPSQPIINSPAAEEEPQQTISGGEPSQEREDEEGDARTEDEAEHEAGNGRKRSESSDEDDELQPVRRSVSLDSLTASKITQVFAVGGKFGVELESQRKVAEVNGSNSNTDPRKVGGSQRFLRFMGGSSVGRSMQNGPVFMKRSSSCSGKILAPRPSRAQNSLLPL